MAINKVVYGADTLVDLTEDTVTAEDVLNSKSFHTPDGVKRTGTASYPVTDVQVNGTSVMDGTIAKVEQPTSDEKTATDQFNTANGGLLSKCMIDLVPVQSGSGDPYPAGGGKNKLPSVLSNIKSINTTGTWTGNNYVLNGVTFAVQVDSADNISGVKATGTASADTRLEIINNSTGILANTAYIMSGCPSGGSMETYRLFANFYYDGTNHVANDFGSGANAQWNNLPDNYSGSIAVRIASGYSIPTGGLQFYPMIRLATETDPTFAPYSNVRPISGHTEVDLYNVGKNLLKNSGAESGSSNGITWKKYADGSVEFSGTATANVSIVFNMTADSWYVGKGTLDLVCSVRANYNPQISGLNFQNDIYVDGVYTRTLQAGNVTYTFSGNRIAIGLSRIYISNGTVIPSGTRFYPQIEIGTSTSAYEPYLGHLYQVQIGSTVYGGYVDLVSGVMTVTQKKIILNGTENWDKSGIATISRFILRTIDSLYGVNNKSAICDTFKSIDYDTETTIRDTEIGFLSYSSGMYSDQIAINYSLDPSITKETFKTYLSNNNVEATLPLTTPLTIQLTPQQIEALVGQNNLSTPLSGQSIETNGVEYKELFTFADVKEYVKPLIPYSNAGSHNAIYRGKYLGDHVTPEQWASIVAGTFDDLFIGDYWMINSVNWRIAHFDYWLGTGDTECTDHHVVIVPDSNLYEAKMNTENVTTGGYYNSEMRGGANYLISGSSNLYKAKTKVDSAFGSAHILTHRELLTNAVSSGNASGCAWYDSSVDLMNEVMVYGTLAWSNGGKGYEVGDGKGQLALFRHDISKATNRAAWWLRGISSAANFARVNGHGIATDYSASTSYGVRPCFAIK